MDDRRGITHVGGTRGADEGVQENSRRHGYLLSMLGITQVIICVNKMDLVDFSEEVYNNIVSEFEETWAPR